MQAEFVIISRESDHVVCGLSILNNIQKVQAAYNFFEQFEKLIEKRKICH